MRFELEQGTYWVGDPGYVLTMKNYANFIRLIGNNVVGGIGTEDNSNEKFILFQQVFNTRMFQYGNLAIPVESGYIAVIAMECIDNYAGLPMGATFKLKADSYCEFAVNKITIDNEEITQ